MESIEHDPRCSYWVDEICVCQQIAELEEKAEWVGKGEREDFASFRDRFFYSTMTLPFYGTMTAAYPFAPDPPLMPPPFVPKYTAGIAEVDERAAERADIYARADAKREWDWKHPWGRRGGF